MYLLLSGTLAAALLGFLLAKLKVPGGMLIGAIVGVVAVNLALGQVAPPAETKLIAQILSGAMIGYSIEGDIVKRLPKLLLPCAILLSMLLLTNLAVGFTIYRLGQLDLLTALLGSIPGGVSDISIIAADTPADAPKVAVLQFVRMFSGLALFPFLIRFAPRVPFLSAGGKDARQTAAQPPSHMQIKMDPLPDLDTDVDAVLPPRHADERALPMPRRLLYIALSLAVATACGLLIRLSGIPAATLIGSLIGIIAFKNLTKKAYLPGWMRRVAQLLSGVYIGSSLGRDNIAELSYLVAPAAIVIVGYLINCVVTALLLHKFAKFPLIDGMLTATPAGASDMALISMDMGIQNPDIATLQIVRLVTSIAVFPTIMFFITGVI